MIRGLQPCGLHLSSHDADVEAYLLLYSLPTNSYLVPLRSGEAMENALRECSHTYSVLTLILFSHLFSHLFTR